MKILNKDRFSFTTMAELESVCDIKKLWNVAWDFQEEMAIVVPSSSLGKYDGLPDRQVVISSNEQN